MSFQFFELIKYIYNFLNICFEFHLSILVEKYHYEVGDDGTTFSYCLCFCDGTWAPVVRLLAAFDMHF